MKRLLVILGSACLAFAHSTADAAGKKRAVVVAAEALAPPQVYLVEPPRFLRPPDAHYFVAIDIPYDLFYLEGVFFLHARDSWYVSDFFEGPWERVGGQRVPSDLRSPRIQTLREVREKTSRLYAQMGETWPKDALFVPEEIDDADDAPLDGEFDGGAAVTPDPNEDAPIRKEESQ